MKRILFVDDEPRILEGLERMLHPCRKQWEMAFASSAREALEILARAPHDVIVTDMRMPEMDGAELLQQVRERYPAMIRIVLSGQFETEAAMRVVQAAHQFLTKPCDAQKLQEVIERSCQTHEIVFDAATRSIVAAIGELPPLPRTYAALVDALNDPQTSLNQVGAIVQRDVAVAAKVLQLVNSAFFGLSHEVSTVSMAVGYLGFEVLKQLVMTVELFRTFTCERRFTGFSVEQIQLHSRSVAVMAAKLPMPQKLAAATSVAALLHDVGKLILAVRLPEPFEQALEASLRENRPLYSVEEEMHGTSHAEIGAYLLALWGLPSPMVRAVSRHHHPIHLSSDSAINMDAAVHIADLLVHEAEGRAAERRAEKGREIETELAGWSEGLPEWRKMAQEIVAAEAAHAS
jgi:HD-like signal output (HDOD) protein